MLLEMTAIVSQFLHPSQLPDSLNPTIPSRNVVDSYQEQQCPVFSPCAYSQQVR